MAEIDELLRLVPPPQTPVASDGDWGAVESALGVTFPADYKLFIKHYGYGELCSFFVVESPFELASVRDHWRNLIGYYEDWAGDVRAIPYAVYPDSPGLLPFGYYGDVNSIAWCTEGPPDSWPIVYCDRAEGFFRLDNTRFLSFVLSVLTGTCPLPKTVIGNEVRQQPFTFRPSSCGGATA